MKKLILITLLVVVLLGASIFIYHSMTSENTTPQTDDQTPQQQDTISDSNGDNLNDVVSDFPDSAGSGFPKDILRAELDNSLKIIGIKDENTFKFSFKVRHFPKYRQEILEELIILKNKINDSFIKSINI